MLTYCMAVVIRLRQDRRAVTALEYALIAGLIALFIATTLTTLGSKTSGVFLKAASGLNSA